MKASYQTDGRAVIVYDADRMDQARSDLFEPSWWEGRGALSGRASGRGTTFFVRHGDEEWALRHYRRGGFVAKFIDDSYLWCGLARTRAWREWLLTADLFRQGLPVPAPVAARVIRTGLIYRADIITRKIPSVHSLAERLQAENLDRTEWQRLGSVLRRFHDAGLCHADLNAHNILVNPQSDFFLIDFDKGRLRPPGNWREDNLERLLRSLCKLQSMQGTFHFADSDWKALRAGHDAGNG